MTDKNPYIITKAKVSDSDGKVYAPGTIAMLSGEDAERLRSRGLLLPFIPGVDELPADAPAGATKTESAPDGQASVASATASTSSQSAGKPANGQARGTIKPVATRSK